VPLVAVNSVKVPSFHTLQTCLTLKGVFVQIAVGYSHSLLQLVCDAFCTAC